MPVVVNLDVMMARRKISLNELSRRVGISHVNLSILKTGKAKGIRFETLAAICKTLDCQPGDILEYVGETVPDGSGTGVPLPSDSQAARE